ncbi:PDR/VanB family oxidoreductase [Nocardia niigatensis]|uniref:PDR/VanB family oxidoreductase n=1 Tax=Nocardia niigatensis TaxID=209249 RepID=UPI0005952557|nr:PDR/VanB family oxidoreductase [Nocardia niigatensis]
MTAIVSGGTNTGAPTGEVRIMRVAARAQIAESVVELVLEYEADLPVWTPGAHIDLVLGPHVRQYSLCGSPEDRHSFTVAILREAEGRGGSVLACDNLAVGDAVEVQGPRNHFPLTDASRYVFVAGGIGITPLVPMVRQAAAENADWRLLYGGRTLRSMAYARDLADEFPDRVRLWPQDTCGLLDLRSEFATVDTGTLIYCCGPEALLAAIEVATAHWPACSLRTERFAPKNRVDVQDNEFQVVFARSGITETVPAGTSILDVATKAGIFVPRSCSEGVCGTCETQLRDGEPDHRDSVLSEEDHAEGAFLPCVSRSKSARLVLDL